MSKFTPLLNVKSGKESVAFYRDALGFKLVHEVIDGDYMHWALLSRDRMELMINQRLEAASEERTKSKEFLGVVFYCEIDSVHEFYAAMRAKGFDVTEPETQPYGVDECYLRDPDGYELGFVSPSAETGPVFRTTNASAIIPVQDVRASIEFYKKYLGFEEHFCLPDASYAVIGLQGQTIHLTLGDARTAPYTHNHCSVFIGVVHIESLWDLVLSADPPTQTRPLEEKPWGMKEFHVRDLDGALLRFGEDM